MKILFLTNNSNTLSLAHWLQEVGENVVLSDQRITIPILEELRPDLIVSYNYLSIISQDVITFMNGNIVNLHISYLPYNKGKHPNLWSILDGTPKGVTIHYIDAGLDTGDIIAQKELHIPNSVTLKESYDQLQREIQSLFMEIYFKKDEWKQMSWPQDMEGTKHTQKDFDQRLAHLISSWDMTGDQLLKLYEAEKRT